MKWRCMLAGGGDLSRTRRHAGFPGFVHVVQPAADLLKAPLLLPDGQTRSHMRLTARPRVGGSGPGKRCKFLLCFGFK